MWIPVTHAIKSRIGEDIILKCINPPIENMLTGFWVKVNDGFLFSWSTIIIEFDILLKHQTIRSYDFFDRLALVANSTSKDFSIKLSNLQIDDRGQYKCFIVTTDNHKILLNDIRLTIETDIDKKYSIHLFVIIAPIILMIIGMVGLCILQYFRTRTKKYKLFFTEI